METIEIVGMANRFYVADMYKGTNCSFIAEKCIKEKHTLFGYVSTDENRVERVAIVLETREGLCGSEWCPATTASLVVKRNLPNFPPWSHNVINPPLTISINPESSDVTCPAFTFSETNGDDYYPNGYYEIKENVFAKNARYVSNRVVYVVTGPSGVGKSFLTDHLDKTELEVFETDSAPVLPDTIYSDVVVIGHKYGHCLNDIKSRLFKKPIIRVCAMS